MHRKKILLFLCSLLCVIALCISLLPWFVSTSIGKEKFLSFVNNRLPGKLKIEKLSLQWSGPQEMEGVKLETTNGKVKFTSLKITCESSLWSLLLPSHDVGRITIQTPDVEIYQNMQQVPIPARPEIKAASFVTEVPLNSYLPLFKIPFIGNLNIVDGKISVFSEGIAPIVFDLAECNLLANKTLSEISIHVNSKTLQNNIEGSILVDSTFKKSNSLDRSLDSKVLLKNFPVEGADKILSLKFPEYRGILTEAIGPSLDMAWNLDSSKSSCKASLEMHSENIQVGIQTELKEGALSLLSPAFLQMTLSSALQEKLQNPFPALKALLSKSPIHFKADISSLNIPKTDQGLLVKQSSFQGEIELTPYQASSMELGCTGTFFSSNLSEELSASLDISMQNKDAKTGAKAQITSEKLFSSPNFSASFTLEKTPSSFLETFTSFPLSETLGAFVEGQAALKGSTLTAQISSPLLQIEMGKFLWQEKKFSLLEPLKVRYLAKTSALDSFIKNPNIVLQKDVQVTALFSRIEIQDLFSFKDLKLEAQISTSSLSFSKLFSLAPYNIENCKLLLSTHSLSQISLNLTNDRFSLQYNGGISPETRTLFWEKPIQVNYILTNQEFKSLYAQKDGPSLLDKAPIQIEISPTSLSLNSISLNQLNLSAKLIGKELVFENLTRTQKVSLQNLEAKMQLIGAKDSLDFSVSSHISGGTLSSEGSINSLSSSDLLLKANVELQKFPMAAFDTLASSSLLPFTGSVLDLKLSIDKNNSSETVWIDGKSPLLKVSGGLILDSKGIFLASSDSPFKIEFLLTPKGYKELSKGSNSSFDLSKEALFKASLLTLKIPFLGPNSKTPDLSHLLLSLQMENDQISFTPKGSKKLLTLTNTTLSLQKKGEEAPLSLSLDTSAIADQKGSLHLDAQMKQFLNNAGHFELSHVESDLIVSFQKFPSAVFEILLPSKNKSFSNLLGPVFDMTLKGSVQQASGPLAIKLNSQNVKLSLEGALTSGVLTLQENALVEIALTPETSRVFLKEVNPLSISSVTSSSPLSIEIVAKGFSLPLSPFSLNQIELPRIRIIPGKVFCQNEGNINLMLGLLKSKQAGQNAKLELWFAPIDFSIHQGVLDLERTEILVASTYDIALWGKLDLPGNRVNMVLGLTAACLNAAFNIRDLPRDYVMHIPLTGTLDHVELNKTVATSKIVALTLWQSKNVAGPAAGVGGALIGGLLNQVLSPPGNEGSTPKAKQPYPWQK